MNRREAINLIEDLDNECKDIVGRSFILIKPSLNDPQAAGYQVQVKGDFKGDKSVCIEFIAGKLGYSVRNEPEKKAITIFEPREKGKAKKYPEVEETGIM